MGRKKMWDERILLPLTNAILKQIDAARSKDETRVDLIRHAIELELKRRERKADIKKRL
jgi:metal-responsive CopG/Arc/MetJ family transcriptional regulator